MACARGRFEKPETGKERRFKVITGLPELAPLATAKCRAGGHVVLAAHRP